MHVGPQAAGAAADGAGGHDRFRRYGLIAAVAVLVAGGIALTSAFTGDDSSTSAPPATETAAPATTPP
ncbi:MAG: hypothetical protein ABWZ99_07315, partial [Ilumatobacteraceae bacterium]